MWLTSLQGRGCLRLQLIDMFGGFEGEKKKNGFNELMVNYASEKLHQAFLACTIGQEASVYRQEGVVSAS
jgi:myosin heavy subunit